VKEAGNQRPGPIPLQISVGSSEVNPVLFNEIVELLAEALVLDYQASRELMVESPQGFGHK
jgi:hypothetical protein